MVTTPHPYKSKRSEILVAGPESSQKSEETSGFRYPGFLQQADQELLGPTVEWLGEPVVGGDRNDYQYTEGPNSFDEGALTVAPYDGFPFAWLLGSDSVSGSGPATHTITPLHTDKPPTMTLEASYIAGSSGSDLVRTYLGAHPNTGRVRVGPEDRVLVDLDLMALGITSDSPKTSQAESVSLPSREPWRFAKTSSDLSLFSTSFARVEDFTFQYTNNSSTERYVESSEAPEPYEILYGNGDWSLTVDLAVTDSSLYSELVSPTDGGFTSTITLEKKSGTETLELKGEECQITSAPHPVPEEGKVVSGVEIDVRKPTVIVKDDTTSTAYV